nr:RecName: Full=Superoxide dismutase [Mn/Fe] [Drechslerella dactyloides]
AYELPELPYAYDA